MTFIVETGAGLPTANAYTTPTWVTSFLASRGRVTENGWNTAGTARHQQAIVEGTSYIERRFGPRVRGSRRRSVIAGRAASGSVTFTLLPQLNGTVTVGQIVYRFVDALVAPNDVLRGGSLTSALTNLAGAITAGGDATTSHPLTVQNFEAIATSTATVLTLEAETTGTSGNDIRLSTTVTGATAAAFANGIDDGPQGLTFPRVGLTGWDGRLVIGIPDKLKQATAEYSVRALVARLDPDLTADSTGALVQRKREKVGPIEEETEYAAGAIPQTFRHYPAADALLLEYLTVGGGVHRG